MKPRMTAAAAVFVCLVTLPTRGDNLPDAVEHPMVERYPGQELRWQAIDNYREFRLPVGPVTGYRHIDDWLETQGRVTRTFYALEGSGRTWSEVYLNYRGAFAAEGFEILAEEARKVRAHVAPLLGPAPAWTHLSVPSLPPAVSHHSGRKRRCAHTASSRTARRRSMRCRRGPR